MNLTFFWCFIIISTAIIEILTVSLVSIWFTLGATVALIAQILHLSFAYQVLLFIIVSFISVILFKPFSNKLLKGKTVKTNTDAIIGEMGIVTKDIGYTFGEIKVKNTLWLASSYDEKEIVKDEKVEIMGIEGAHVIVRKWEDD